MYPYIVCFCGRAVGCIYDLYLAMRADAVAKYMKEHQITVAPENLTLTEDLHMDLGWIWKALKVDLPCCRSRLMTTVEFKTVY